MFGIRNLVPAGPYDIADRSDAALPRPRFEDVRGAIADLLPYFTEELIRNGYKGTHLPFVLGARSDERFPASCRLRARSVLAWSARKTAVMEAGEAFQILFDPTFAPLKPYAAVNVRHFGGPIRSLIQETERRLQLDPFGFSVLWFGQGGYVTPLHHDGALVHGRWHLVVKGEKQWDFVPPGARQVPRMPFWDLHHRFSRLYKQPLPDAWLTDGSGAERYILEPGQMVTWGRRWWHRVEIARRGVTVGLSTRGHRPGEIWRPRCLFEQLHARAVGEIEDLLDRRGDLPEVLRLEELRRELPAAPLAPRWSVGA